MSQFPQQPPMTPPPVAPPPPGMPPYGAAPYGGAPAPQKTNVPAIVSLVCGILGCVPFLTGLAAIVLGVVGIKKANDPQVNNGKPMAIIGLILGILSLGFWALFGTGVFALIKGTESQRDLARQFIQDVAAGNVDAAYAQTDGTSVSREEIEDLSKTLQGWGTITDTTVVGVNAQPGRTEVAGSVTFGNTPKSFQAVVVKQDDGSYKISGIEFK